MTSLLLLLACAGGPDRDSGLADDTGAAAYDPTLAPYGVGRRTLVLEDPERPLTVELWYPTASAGEGHAVADLVGDSDDRAAYLGLLDAAPADCPTRFLGATAQAEPVAGALPFVVASHCHTCTRFSNATMAEHLAGRGWLVAAPDHAGNTLFEELDGVALGVDDETLALRTADLERVLDAVLDGTLGDAAGAVVDPALGGVMGHSFGAVTAGKVLQDRAELQAGLFMGAPIDSPLLDGATASELQRPGMHLLLAEDNSITTLGNDLIRSNYEAMAGEAWLVEVADAGHWTVSDLVGLTEGFMPGCGDDQRMTDGTDFTYLDPATGRTLSAAVASAFFDHAVLGRAGAADWLRAQDADARLEVAAR